MFKVYALESLSKKYIYVGLTSNLEKRFSQHQNGKEKTTAPYRPYQILIIETYPTRQEARKREKYLKSGSGKELLKSLQVNNAGVAKRQTCLPAGRRNSN